LIKIDIASKEISLNKTDKLTPILFLQHPNFTMETPENNLMLIKLHVPLKLTKMVLAVLPNTTDDREGEKCTLFSWGWSRQSYQMGKSMTIKVTKKMFCAGSSISTIIPCEEMTAAPILCQNQLYGILSWSKGCALRGDTGYYTKISHYTDWILKVIRTY
ncbi:Anionic trypsin-2, partial [Galemys pyrenaicus]